MLCEIQQTKPPASSQSEHFLKVKKKNHEFFHFFAAFPQSLMDGEETAQPHLSSHSLILRATPVFFSCEFLPFYCTEREKTRVISVSAKFVHIWHGPPLLRRDELHVSSHASRTWCVKAPSAKKRAPVVLTDSLSNTPTKKKQENRSRKAGVKLQQSSVSTRSTNLTACTRSAILQPNKKKKREKMQQSHLNAHKFTQAMPLDENKSTTTAEESWKIKRRNSFPKCDEKKKLLT